MFPKRQSFKSLQREQLKDARMLTAGPGGPGRPLSPGRPRAPYNRKTSKYELGNVRFQVFCLFVDINHRKLKGVHLGRNLPWYQGRRSHQRNQALPVDKFKEKTISLYQKMITFGSTFHEIPAVLTSTVSHNPTLGPAGPVSPLAPSRPLKPCTQNPWSNIRSVTHHNSWKSPFWCWMLLQTHSVSLNAGESRGSGESTCSLQEDERCVSNQVRQQHANALWSVIKLY